MTYKLNIFDILKIAESEMEYGLNSENTIKWVKGNVPIEERLLNKYQSARDIFDSKEKINNFKVDCRNIIKVSKNIKIGELKKQAYEVFRQNHKATTFKNISNEIVVNISGIYECVEKIYNNRRQRNYIDEHMIVFSHLGEIISQAKLINQSTNYKEYRKNIFYWNYYMIKVQINKVQYNYLFDVRAMQDGQNQYRIGRLEKIKKTD